MLRQLACSDCYILGLIFTNKKNKIMKLKEEFENVEIMFENQKGTLKYDELCESVNSCVKIAENFAIKFALWKETIYQDDNGLYYNESRAQISIKNPVDIIGLLNAFKKQQE